jgi:type IV secretion system protein VirB8
MIDERLKDYVTYTKNFEQIEQDIIKDKIKLLKTIIAVVAFIAIAEAIAITIMMPLKEKVPVIFKVDKATGSTQQVALADVEQFNINKDEALDKSNLANYVIAHESYDYNYIQSLYSKTLLMSAENVARDYTSLYAETNPNNLYDKYNKSTTVTIDINNISFYKDATAVRFTRKVVTNNNPPLITNEIATIAYKYVSASMSDEDRLINPLGFQVISYRLDKDLSVINTNNTSNNEGK